MWPGAKTHTQKENDTDTHKTSINSSCASNYHTAVRHAAVIVLVRRSCNASAVSFTSSILIMTPPLPTHVYARPLNVIVVLVCRRRAFRSALQGLARTMMWPSLAPSFMFVASCSLHMLFIIPPLAHALNLILIASCCACVQTQGLSLALAPWTVFH